MAERTCRLPAFSMILGIQWRIGLLNQFNFIYNKKIQMPILL